MQIPHIRPAEGLPARFTAVVPRFEMHTLDMADHVPFGLGREPVEGPAAERTAVRSVTVHASGPGKGVPGVEDRGGAGGDLEGGCGDWQVSRRQVIRNGKGNILLIQFTVHRGELTDNF